MFLLMGDEKYSHTLEYSVDKLNEIYPGKDVLLLDWGINPSNIIKIKKKNRALKVIRWELFKDKNVLDQTFIFNMLLAHIRPASAKATFRYYVHFVKRFVNNDSPITLLKFEQMILEKIKCFLFACEYFDGSFLFLDADAILCQPVPELFSLNVDLAVTRRRESELNYETGKCAVLNSGVIYFGPDRIKRKEFLNLWIRHAYSIKEPIAEQTALTRLLVEQNNGLLKYQDNIKVELETGDSAVVIILPCEKYNFNWIEEFIHHKKELTEQVKIVHFKGGRHDKSQFMKLANNIFGSLTN